MRLLQSREWRFDRTGRVSARISLSVPDLAIPFLSRDAGAAMAAQIGTVIAARLERGRDSADTPLPRFDSASKTEKGRATANRRARRLRQASGTGAAGWKQSRQTLGTMARRAGVKPRSIDWGSDKWLVDRFRSVGGTYYEPDGRGTPGRESGYLAGGIVVRFRGGTSGEARFGIFFPSFKHGRGGRYGRAAYIEWAEARGARIVSVPPDADAILAQVLRDYGQAMAAGNERKAMRVFTLRNLATMLKVGGRVLGQAEQFLGG